MTCPPLTFIFSTLIPPTEPVDETGFTFFGVIPDDSPASELLVGVMGFSILIPGGDESSCGLEARVEVVTSPVDEMSGGGIIDNEAPDFMLPESTDSDRFLFLSFLPDGEKGVFTVADSAKGELIALYGEAFLPASPNPAEEQRRIESLEAGLPADKFFPFA